MLPLRLDLAPPVLLLLPPAQVPQSVTSSDLHLSPVMKVQRGSQPPREATEAAVNLTTDREHEVQSVRHIYMMMMMTTHLVASGSVVPRQKIHWWWYEHCDCLSSCPHWWW